MSDETRRDGVNPAEWLCGLAKRRWFQPRSAEPQAGDQPMAATLKSLAAIPDDDFDANWERVIRCGDA